MWWLLIAVAIIIGVAWCVCAMSGKSDEEIRKMRLIETARKKYPEKDIIAGLDAMYIDTIRDIVKNRTDDTDEKEEDMIMLFTLRNQMIVEKIKQEEYCHI